MLDDGYGGWDDAPLRSSWLWQRSFFQAGHQCHSIPGWWKMGGDCCEQAGWIQCDVASLPTKQLGGSVISVATREIISSRTAHVVIFWGKQGIDCN